MTASPNITSFGPVMCFNKDEATAAERTWVFYLSNTADGTPATGKTIATTDFKISKNGAAFGNAVGTVTEMSLGWYKMVFDAGDLDTLGVLACELSGEAGVDPIHIAHQVNLMDRNVATISPADGALVAAKFGAGAFTAAKFAADALDTAAFKDGAFTAAKFDADFTTAVQAGMATAAQVAAVSHKVRNTTHALGTITGTTGVSSGVSMKDAVNAVITATGTFSSGTITVQTCADPKAAVPVWVDTALTMTSDGTKTVTGPVSAVRAKLTGATAATVVVTAEVSRPI